MILFYQFEQNKCLVDVVYLVFLYSTCIELTPDFVWIPQCLYYLTGSLKKLDLEDDLWTLNNQNK